MQSETQPSSTLFRFALWVVIVVILLSVLGRAAFRLYLDVNDTSIQTSVDYFNESVRNIRSQWLAAGRPSTVQIPLVLGTGANDSVNTGGTMVTVVVNNRGFPLAISAVNDVLARRVLAVTGDDAQQPQPCIALWAVLQPYALSVTLDEGAPEQQCWWRLQNGYSLRYDGQTGNVQKRGLAID